MGRLEQSMGRLEEAIGGLHRDMAPVQVLPDVLASLERMEALMERLVAAVEAERVVTPPPAASARGGRRVRGA
jgi:hypothetical protein